MGCGLQTWSSSSEEIRLRNEIVRVYTTHDVLLNITRSITAGRCSITSGVLMLELQQHAVVVNQHSMPILRNLVHLIFALSSMNYVVASDMVQSQMLLYREWQFARRYHFSANLRISGCRCRLMLLRQRATRRLPRPARRPRLMRSSPRMISSSRSCGKNAPR